MNEHEQLPSNAQFYLASIERQHREKRRFWRVFWLGGASKFIIGDLALVLLYRYGFPRIAAPPTPEARVIAALRWHALPAFLFIFSIYAVIIGRARYLRAAYDPVASHAAGDETWTIRVNNRILLNLIENYVPFFVATLVAASYLTSGPRSRGALSRVSSSCGRSGGCSIGSATGTTPGTGSPGSS